MPAPRSVGRFNRSFMNPLFLRVAGRLPGFAIVSHVGRKSGRAYRTPVNAFRNECGYIIALTYGPKSDRVKNVLAAGSCGVARGALSALLSMEGDIEIVAEASRGDEVLPAALDAFPDVALLDIVVQAKFSFRVFVSPGRGERLANVSVDDPTALLLSR